MNVLIIPEDFSNDQYILKPLFSRLFRTLGKTSVHLRVCHDPRLRGVGEALKLERMREIVQRYGKIDIFILCIDRDGDTNRSQRLNRLEVEFNNGQTFLAENAWEEIETWVLAGLRLLPGWRWADVRAEVSVKERYFEPLAAERGVADTRGGGRELLGEEASRRIDAIRQKCPEDFDTLARRLEEIIQNN